MCKPGVANTYAGKYSLFSPQVSKNRKVVFNDRFNSMKVVENSCVPRCLPFGQNILVDTWLKIIKRNFKYRYI